MGHALHVVFRLLPELGHAGYSFQLDCWDFGFLVESEEGVESGSLCLMWCLWGERNRRTFEDLQLSNHSMKLALLSVFHFLDRGGV